jgi:hypothetical protein
MSNLQSERGTWGFWVSKTVGDSLIIIESSLKSVALAAPLTKYA